MDKCFFWCFVLTFVVLYCVSAGLAVQGLGASGDATITGEDKAYAGAVAYVIGVVWIIIAVVFYWRSAKPTVK